MKELRKLKIKMSKSFRGKISSSEAKEGEEKEPKF